MDCKSRRAEGIYEFPKEDAYIMIYGTIISLHKAESCLYNIDINRYLWTA